MQAHIVSFGTAWFRKITSAYTDRHGNLALGLKLKPEDMPEAGKYLNLRRIFPGHVILDLLDCQICYTNADDTHRRTSAFNEWLCTRGGPSAEPCLSVKFNRDRDAIILHCNPRAKVPTWCDSIRLFRKSDSLELLTLPLLWDVNVASYK
ncbi:MAG: hypothetical protein WCW31_04445 [Patescibacteria group bacterium]|jgi:hypothetical protein